MQAAATPLDVLCLGRAGEPGVGEPGRLRVSVASPDERDNWPDPATVDCLLVDTTGGEDDPVGTVERVRERFPSTPVLVFTPDDRAVDGVLRAGATDVVRSSPAATPDRLVRRRVENVREADTDASRSGGDGTGYGGHERLLEHVGESLGDVLWVMDPDAPRGDRVEFVSAAYEAVWGRSRSGLLHGEHSFYETVHPEDRDRLLSVGEPAWTEGDTIEETYRIVRPDGEPRWIHERALGVEEAGGRRIVGMCRDITDRIERDRRLERQNDLFRKAQDIADVGAWEFNLEGPNRWTEEVYEILGASQETPLTLEAVEGLYHPEDWPEISAALDRAVEDGEPFDLEARVAPGTGGTRWVRVRGDPQTENGEVVRVRGTMQDITDRVERERQLQAERDLVERILEVSSVGIMVFEADGTVISANEQATEIIGLGAGTLEGAGSPPDPIRFLSAEGEPVPTEQRVVRQVKDTREAVYDQKRVVETPTGERRTIIIDVVPLFEAGELRRLVATFEDITKRVEREQRLQTQRDELARLDRINSIIRDVDTALVGAESRDAVERIVCDELSESGQYLETMVFRANGEAIAPQATCRGTAAELTRELPPDAPTRLAVETGETHTTQASEEPSEWTVCQQFVDGDVDAMAAIPLTYGNRTYGALTVCAAGEQPFTGRELDVLDELGDTVGHAIAAVESRQREAILTALYEATQDLLAAEHRQAVCDVVVETAASVLEPEGTGLFLFDDTENALELVAGTESLHEFFGEMTSFGPGRPDSITWQSYIEGEPRFVPDVHDSEHLAYDDTSARSALFLPLGDHGVFVVATADRISFDEDRRRLIDLLAATTEAALDRVAGQAGLRELDRRLTERSDRLEHLEQLFGLVDSIERALRRASTRREAERATCEQLTGTDPYAFAWVGDMPPDGTDIEPRTWAAGDATADDGRGYLDAVSLALGGDTPAARAVRAGNPVVVENVTDHLREADWAAPAVERDYQSVLAVPLAYGDATDGVLTVYATKPDAFGDRARSTVERLGETLPQVAAGLERDRTVLADRVTELDLSLPTPDRFPNALAATVDRPVRYRDLTPRPDGETQVSFRLPETPVEAVRTLAESFVTVDSLDTIDRNGETTVRAALTGQTVATTLLSCGAIQQEIVAHADETAVTVRLPHDADVRGFLNRVDERIPGVELLARRSAGTAEGTGTAVHQALSEELTDRQREVLRTAYEAGFFQSPRETTGVELADMLGVSQPTVTHHLREAQRRLYNALFEDLADERPASR